MKIKLQEATKPQPSPAVSDIVSRTVKFRLAGCDQQTKVICLKVSWGKGWKYVHIFKTPYFDGMGELSGWYYRNLLQQVKMLLAIRSGEQQGGEDPDPALTQMLKESIRTALGL